MYKGRSEESLLARPKGSILSRSPDSEKQQSLSLAEPESEARRFLELQLLANYFTNILSSMDSIWTFHEVPSIALQPGGNAHRNLLYAVLAYSAAHVVLTKPPDTEQIRVARDTYLGISLQEQRQAVSELGSHNAVAVSLTAILLMGVPFMGLQERILEQPYEPPMDWLRMGQGVRKVFDVVTADRFDGRGSMESQFQELFSKPRGLTDFDAIFSEDHLRDYMHLLRPAPSLVGSGDDETDWDSELVVPVVYDAYKKALSYLGYLHEAITRNHDEPLTHFCRRLFAFPMLIPHYFVTLISERRPRALVILGYFFAIMTQARSLWYVGNMAESELRAIRECLPHRWREELRWPFAFAGISFESI
jgi:hypothetical protein